MARAVSLWAAEVLLPGADDEPRLGGTPGEVMSAVAASLGFTDRSLRDRAISVGICAVTYLRGRRWPLFAWPMLSSIDVWAQTPTSLPPLPPLVPPIFLVSGPLHGEGLDALFEVSPARSESASLAFVVNPARLDHMLSCMIRVGLLRLTDLTSGGVREA